MCSSRCHDRLLFLLLGFDLLLYLFFFFFFFNDTATTEIYTLSLHDALPIFWTWAAFCKTAPARACGRLPVATIATSRDRKSTRLNSSHSQISYAVFCLKKKKKTSSHCDCMRRPARIH